MMKSRFFYAAVMAAVVALNACAVDAGSPEEDSIAASVLQKVAAQVDDFVANSASVNSMAADEILQKSADPKLLGELKNYSLRVIVEGRNSSILMCTRDGARAVAEDAGCSARTDLAYFRQSGISTCARRLSLKQVCGE
jgi:hypothetical protein